MSDSTDERQIRRLVFKEIVDGDRLKFVAKAAPGGNGGGARDLRFRPFDSFDGVFGRMLTGRSKETRRRGNLMQDVEVYTSVVGVLDHDGNVQNKDLKFEPPTDARAGEGRLTRVHKLGLEPPPETERVLFLLFQTAEPTPFIAFATGSQVRDKAWATELNDFFAEALAATTDRRVARGFIDFERHSRFIG